MLTHIGKLIVLTALTLFAIVLALKLFVDRPIQLDHEQRLASIEKAMVLAKTEGWSIREDDPWNRSSLPDHVGEYRAGRIRPFDLGTHPVDIFYSEEEIRPAGEALLASSRQLQPPRQIRAAASMGGVDLVWSPHPDNGVREVGYVVYRWSDGERPAPRTETALTKPAFRDIEVESDREYRYAILSVLEREILGVRTLEKSAWSEVLSVRSAQTRRIRYLGPESEGQARFLVEVHYGGDWVHQTFVVSPGDRIGRDDRELPFASDYRLLEVQPREREVPRVRREAVFETDGRRRVSEETNEPIFEEVTEMEREAFTVVRIERRSSREHLELQAGEGPVRVD